MSEMNPAEWAKATQPILAYFEHGHLPPRQSQIASHFRSVAHFMAENLEGPELTAGLRKLLEAKDCCVRASL